MLCARLGLHMGLTVRHDPMANDAADPVSHFFSRELASLLCARDRTSTAGSDRSSLAALRATPSCAGAGDISGLGPIAGQPKPEKDSVNVLTTPVAHAPYSVLIPQNGWRSSARFVTQHLFSCDVWAIRQVPLERSAVRLQSYSWCGGTRRILIIHSNSRAGPRGLAPSVALNRLETKIRNSRRP